jgi:menaquinone-dependent protoporphyrinogen oxidase
LADVLRRYGLDVDVAQPEHIKDLYRYDGFVLGSAIYRGKWKQEALDLIEEHSEVIAASPCWLFSSGPIMENEPSEPFRPDEEAKLMAATGAREHRLFGGKLDIDELSFTERWLARWVKAKSGDARPWVEIEEWAIRIAAELTSDELPRISPTDDSTST